MAKTLGPFGGSGASSWDENSFTGVRKIIVSYVEDEPEVRSLQFEYDKNGKNVLAPKHGGNGTTTREIELDFPREYIRWISGYVTRFGDTAAAVNSLTFTTSQRNIGPFGKQVGAPFSTRDVPGQINVGFFGSDDGTRIRSIGAYLGPLPIPQNGGNGGRAWDDGYYTTIRSISLSWGDEAITSIQTEYDLNGEPKLSPLHGMRGVSQVQIKLNYPTEYLNMISGYLDESGERPYVRSLRFHTNMRVFGPFGDQIGTSFTTPPITGRIVGFFGRSGAFLDALGAYYF